MRISYWSSDVCSSDLHPLLVIEAFELLSREPGFDSRRVRLLIGGDGVDAGEVDRRIAALPFARRLGWLKPPEMRAILTRSDVGLLPMNFASPAFNNKRSEERRVGKECVSTCRSRWSPYH